MYRAKRIVLALASAGLLLAPAGLRAEDGKKKEEKKELKQEFVQQGEASFYADKFQGRKTATGERFDMNEQTAAHRTLPLGTEAKVTNLENGKETEVQITDRGPYARGRVIDLSKEAARDLGMVKDGTTEVKVEAKPEQQDGLYGREDTDKPAK